MAPSGRALTASDDELFSFYSFRPVCDCNGRFSLVVFIWCFKRQISVLFYRKSRRHSELLTSSSSCSYDRCRPKLVYLVFPSLQQRVCGAYVLEGDFELLIAGILTLNVVLPHTVGCEVLFAE